MPRTIDYPLVAGVDESKNSKLQRGPRLIRAENLRIVDKDMARKRRGTATLAAGAVDSGSPTPVGPVRLATHKGQLLVCSEESLWTVGAGGTRLEELDAMPSTTLESVVSLGHYGAANVVACGCAETTAFRVWSWVSYDGTNYRIHIMTLDLERGAGSAATGYYTTTSSMAKMLKVIAVGAKVVVFFGDSTNEIRYVDVTSATSGPYVGQTGTLLYNDISSSLAQWFDVAPHETGYALVYKFSPTQYKLKRMSSAHAELQSATITASNFSSSPRLSIAGNVTSIAVAVGSDNSTTLAVAWYNNSLTQTASATFSDTTVWGASTTDTIGVAIAPYTSAGTLAVVMSGFSSGSRRLYKVGVLTTGGTFTAANLKINAAAASKPWVYAGDVYSLVHFWCGTQGNSYYAVVRYTGGEATPIARQHPVLEARVRDARAPEEPLADTAACVAQNGRYAAVPIAAVDRFSSPGVAVDPTGQMAVDPDQTDAVGVQAVTLVGVDGFHFDHASRARWQAVTVGDYTCFAGGVIGKFDGRRRTEIGFPSFPFPTVTTQTGSGAIEAGTFAVGVVWEYTDFNSNREQSAVYIVDSLTISGTTDNIRIHADTPPFHAKHWYLTGTDHHKLSMAVYRTSAGGTLLHRVEGGGAALFQTAIDINSVNDLDYTDNNNSTTISLTSRELIYATQFGSNELQHQMPPPSNVICAHENRLFFVSAEDPTLVGYTLQQFPGQSLAWNGSLVIKFDVPIVALASQDGNLIAFGENTIYTVTGRPADNTGASTGYDPPILLSGHIGCVNRRSVLPSPVGVWFESARGLEVLPRGGGAVEFRGDAVYRKLASYPIITAALHNPYTSEVLFSCVTAEDVSATGVVIAFDYESRVWFIRSYQDEPISDMVLDGEDVVFGVYTSSSSLSLWKEDAGFDDANGGYIGWTVELGDLRHAKASGLQSFWGATILGEVNGPAKLRIEESADDGAYNFGHTYTLPDETDDLSLEYSVTERKARKHRLRLSEQTMGTADTEGVAISMLTLELEPAAGRARSPAHWRG